MSEGANAAGRGCEGTTKPRGYAAYGVEGRSDGARSTATGPGTYFTPAGAKAADADYRTSTLRIPTMRAGEPAPWEYDATTCYEAGYLVEKNAGWRQVRPVISADACTGCLSCYMYCPDGAIRKTHAQGVAVFVDYDFCKGCGICKTVCRFDAIVMASEAESLAKGAAAATATGSSDAAGNSGAAGGSVTEGGAR